MANATAPERRHCPGRKPPFLVVKRPARLYKSATQIRCTLQNAKGALPLRRGPDSRVAGRLPRARRRAHPHPPPPRRTLSAGDHSRHCSWQQQQQQRPQQQQQPPRFGLAMTLWRGRTPSPAAAAASSYRANGPPLPPLAAPPLPPLRPFLTHRGPAAVETALVATRTL